VIVPIARGIGVALAFAWRVTAYVSRAVGRVLAWLARVLIAVPVTWVWSWTGAPVLRGLRAAGRWYRRAIWRPVAEAVAEVRRSVRRAFVGAPSAPARRQAPARPRQAEPYQHPALAPKPMRAAYEPPGPAGYEPQAPAAYEPTAPVDPRSGTRAPDARPPSVPRSDPRRDFRRGDADRRTPPSHR
jgi:hypothetical protein